MLQAVIFDMDGLLIDSEILWQEAEFLTFSNLGVTVTKEMCRKIVGWRMDAIVEHFYKCVPWKGATLKEVEKRITDRMLMLIPKRGSPKPGALEALAFVKKQGVRIGLASGSYYEIIQSVLDHLDIADAFECVCSSEDEAHGKPQPDVYLTAIRKLNAEPNKCLAIEDSYNGILAAKAAGMRSIAVPDTSLPQDARLVGLADVTLSSLQELDQKVWSHFNH